MSKVSALYHIVFATKCREMTIPHEHAEHLYRFIWKTIEDNDCQLLRIGGIENHIHILMDLSPGKSLSTVVRNIKSYSSGWMQRDVRFPTFRGWAKEYFATSVSPEVKHNVTAYIRNQRIHHGRESVGDEFFRLYNVAGLQFCDNDLYS